MKRSWSDFTRLQLLLLLGATASDVFVDCFNINTKRFQQVGASPGLRQMGTSTALLYSHNPSSTNSSSLLQGKVLVLQDVVKEMDARHQELLEQSEIAKQEYHQKLETLEKDLEESKTVKGDHQTAITNLENSLAELIEQHVLDLQNLEHKKDQEREEETKKLKVQNEESLDKLRKAFEERVQELELDLETNEKKVKNLSTKLKDTETGSDDTEKDAIIEKLKKEIEAQKEQLDSSKMEQSEEGSGDATTEDSNSIDTLAIEALKAEHEEVMEDYKAQLDALCQEKDQLSDELSQIDDIYKAKLDAFCDGRNKKLSELEAKHQWVVEDYESRLDAIFAEKEEVSKDLQAQHQEIVATYETKLQAAVAETNNLSNELATMQATCDEQVEIAEASVRAGETREANLQRESKVLTKRVQLFWIAAKLTNLVAARTEKELASVWEEREDLEQENEELYEELETTKKGVQDLIAQLENQNNMWQKLRSKVTGAKR